MSQVAKARDPIAAFKATRRRLVIGVVLLFAVMGIGSAGYWYLGYTQLGGKWSLGDCIYMTAITITTVGFEEVIEVDKVIGGREWTLALLVLGVSANLYVISSITSFFVESDFSNVRRYRRVQKAMAEVSGHYIVCGVGRTGIHVVRELLAVGERVVAIDERQDLLVELQTEGVLALRGDATDDDVLEQAGIGRAKGIVATLDDDKTNLFLVISARQNHPKLRIVAKAVTASAVSKLDRAGADAVVSPSMIGGMRLASELLRPQVVRFLDEMLRDKEAQLRIEEAVVGQRGPIVGQTLIQARLRERVGVLIMAVRDTAGRIEHAPAGNRRIEAGETLIAIGRPDQIRSLREMVGQV